MKGAYLIIVRGLVQGVAFRYYTKEAANSFMLNGWVKNLADGSVEIEVSGDEDALDKLIEWCHSGSPAAKVEELLYHKIDYFSATNFEIIR